MSSLLFCSILADDLGLVPGNTGSDRVSPAPDVDAGESGSRAGLDAPRAYCPRLDVPPWPFGEFEAALRGERGRSR